MSCGLFDGIFLSIVRFILTYISRRNIIYIKLLQWTFKESKRLPPNVNEYLNSFRDSAPYTENDIDIDLIHDLEKKSIENGDNLVIDMTPINSGTISIVFSGVLNELPIVVKMKRKNVEISFENVRSTLLSLSNVSNFFTGNDYKPIIEKITETLKEQCDFQREFSNIQLFHKCSKKYNLMEPIYAFKKYSNNNLIMMNRSLGINPEKLPEEHFKKFKWCYLKSLFFLFFKKSIIHSDVHYGNMLYNSETGKMTFIDLGSIIIMTPEQSSCFQEMTLVATTDPDNFGEMVIKNANICSSDEVNRTKLIDFINKYEFKFQDKLEDKLIEISKFMVVMLGQPITFMDIFPSIIIMIVSIVRISADIDGTDDMLRILNVIHCK